VFSDWVAAAQSRQPLYPFAPPGVETQARVRDVLGFCGGDESPRDPAVDARWERDGVAGELLSWSVGYGPRTQAVVLRPAGVTDPLPGVVALHDHGGFKYYGKEKIADGPDATPPVLAAYRAKFYDGRAYPNDLARAGFTVLVHDTFMWGSRAFPVETMPMPVRDMAAAQLRMSPPEMVVPVEVEFYNLAAAHHEHWAAKYANVLGATLAGVVCYEDRVAANYLLSRPDVRGQRIGCIGLSGGGNRAAMLNATHDRMGSAVIVGQMSTYAGLLDHNMSHAWMLFPAGWARYGDWPDLAACRAPSPLLVQYDLGDDLFTEQGMRDADWRLRACFAAAGRPDGYSGEFYGGPHKFDRAMQASAFEWLARTLA